MPFDAARLLQLLTTFDWDRWERELLPLIAAHRTEVLNAAGRQVSPNFDPTDPFTMGHFTQYVGERITSLNGTTRDDVTFIIRRAMEQGAGASPREIGASIHAALSERFEGYQQWRADRIARTETAIAYNHGTVLSARQIGVDRVLVSDGDYDAECVGLDGSTQSVEWALSNPISHPNCRRSFSPWVG